MAEYVVDLGSIIVEAKDSTDARKIVKQLIEDGDIKIDQVIKLD